MRKNLHNFSIWLLAGIVFFFPSSAAFAHDLVSPNIVAVSTNPAAGFAGSTTFTITCQWTDDNSESYNVNIRVRAPDNATITNLVTNNVAQANTSNWSAPGSTSTYTASIQWSPPGGTTAGTYDLHCDVTDTVDALTDSDTYTANLDELAITEYLYWVGGNGDSVNANANDWSTTNPGSCNNGAGNASAVPGASTVAVFDADCDNGAVLSSNWTVAGIQMDDNYTGTLNVGAFTLQVSGTTSVGNGGTLQISSTTGTKTFIGNVAINSGGTWNNSGNESVTFNGGLTFNGTSFTGGSGTYSFTTNNQTIAGSSAFTMSTMSLNSGYVLVTASNLTTDTLTAAAANSWLWNSGTMTINTSASFANDVDGFIQLENSTLTLKGSMTEGGLFAGGSGNTVNFNSGSAQTIPSGSYYHVNVNGGQTATLGGKVVVSGDLNVSNNSTLNTSGANSYQLTVGQDFIVASGSTFTANSGTVFLDPTQDGTITMNGSAFNNLTFTDSTATNAYWKLDESGTVASVTDSSGNGNTGTTVGSPVSYNTTLPTVNFTDSNALDLNGSSQNFTRAFAGSTGMNLGGSDMTIAVWINPDTISNGNYYSIISGGGASRFFSVWLIASGSELFQAYLDFGGAAANGWTWSFPHNFTAGSWQHLAVVRSGNTVTVFRNGEILGGVYRTGTSNNNGTVYVGYDNNDGGVRFDGKMDDFRIYNRALTTSEVQSLYTGNDLSDAAVAAGTKSLGSNATVNGTFTINAGTLAPGSNTLFLKQALTAGNNASLNGTGTVEFNGTSGSYTVAAPHLLFGTLKVNGSGGSWQLDSNGAAIADDLIVSAGTLNVGIGTTSVQGSVNLTGGTFTQSTSTLVLNPTTANETFTSASKTLNNLVTSSADGLVAWWKMDETAANSCTGGTNDSCDSTSSGLDLAWEGGAAASTSHALVNFSNPRSLTLDGSGDHARNFSPTAGILPVGAAPRTMTMWARYTNAAQGAVFGGYGNDADFENFQFGLDNAGLDRFQFYGWAGGDVYSAVTASTYADNQFHHFAVTYDGTTLTAYVDGKFLMSEARALNTTLDDICIGGEVASDACDRDFDGEVDDFRVYNRVLTTDEIAALARGHSLSGTGTITLQDNLDVNGSVVLGDGTLNASNKTITVAQNWTNRDATFTYGTSTVDFDDDTKNNVISGNNTFYNFSISTATAKTVSFESGKTQSIASGGSLTLTGVAGNVLTLAPLTAATSWMLTTNSCTMSVDRASVSYSNASGGNQIISSNTTDGTNNSNWCFSSCAACGAGGSSGATSGGFFNFF